MIKNLFELLALSTQKFANKPALHFQRQTLSYQQLFNATRQCISQLQGFGVSRFDRVAIFLPKQFESVISIFASSALGAIFVPINPLLKPAQVIHILQDCSVKLLITNDERYQRLLPMLSELSDIKDVLLLSPSTHAISSQSIQCHRWLPQVIDEQIPAELYTLSNSTEIDAAAIFYTSGSTGKSKGVVLSNRNILVGASSVSSYLYNTANDVLLALLPLSFDYGFSQITTAVQVGASVVLLDYVLVQDVVKAVHDYKVTGIAAVPPLWSQLVKANWSKGSNESVRYFTNSGGTMPLPLLNELQQVFKHAEPYLMYGLTESFRSTFLAPSEILKRPGSIGKAIPNVEITVVREDGSLCGPNEPGELVHRGPLVSLGYWNAPEQTAERFKADPMAPTGIQLPQLAVFSGDTVKYDEEGYLYFIGRRDEMIKTSGYRVSPTEVEDAVYRLDPAIQDVAALGIFDGTDQAILVLVALAAGATASPEQWLLQLKRSLPNFMLPKAILLKDCLPKNPNGKIDRKALAQDYQQYFFEGAPI
ncbi:acyl-CoA ligase (AMP-forming), exosortase A system-associated [Alishewanella tabrizica]|uniref:Acyl-CoA ligase (AMP-forming), exosortase A system-associated n=1 Tax=Alishewanella tabrizica TaxID=671278 RepID=A0ABQ2WQ99_9ALTE|nr:acyl-CoA ligase (AMP-forming), exosortase A system-associated [Alishewanella tabrizica]GGW62789.1 acyl-CoA ligase (AMP-forming), exosortase A system-associated [Alishewanella tabrizica]